MLGKFSKNDVSQAENYFEIGDIEKEDLEGDTQSIRVDPGFCMDAEVVDLRNDPDWFKKETGVDWAELEQMPTQKVLEVRRRTALKAKQLESARKKNDPIQLKIVRFHELNHLKDRVVELAERMAAAEGQPTDHIFRKYGLEPTDFD